MKKVGLVTAMLLLFPCVALAQTNQTAKHYLLYFVEEIRFLDTMCDTVDLSDKLNNVLLTAGITADDIQSGGRMYKTKVVAMANATDKLSGLSPSDACYHLKLLYAEDGVLVSPNVDQ